MVVWAAEERVRSARLQVVRSRRTAWALRIATEVFLVLALELLGKVGNKMVIKVLTTKMGVTSEDGSLDGSAVSNSLIWVDGFVWLFAIEEVGDELDDAWDAS